MNRVYLVRHGENLANLTKEFSHRKVDYPLTEKGILQAQQTAAWFRGCQVDGLFSSPLIRAQQTAQTIGQAIGITVQVVESFREVNVGDLEGQPVSKEIWAIYTQIFDQWTAGNLTACFPGGEDYHTLWKRMHQGLQLALHKRQEQTVVIVGHGGIFSIAMRDLCPEVDLNWLARLPNPNCSISEILIEQKNGNLLGHLARWADVSHLSGYAAEFVNPLPED